MLEGRDAEELSQYWESRAKCDNDCSFGLLLLVSTEVRLLMEPRRRETVSDLLRGQKAAHRGFSPTRPSCHLPSRPRVW